jgi:hypothetical protein
MQRSLRARLRWLRSAGGLGGLRVYSPGVVCGIMISVWSYWQRNVDAPTPLIAVLMFAPYYALAGFWMARKRSVEVGGLAGAVTAVLGFVIVSLTMIAYAAGTEPWPTPVAYLLYGLTFLIPAAFVGATADSSEAHWPTSTSSARPGIDDPRPVRARTCLVHYALPARALNLGGPLSRGRGTTRVAGAG